MLDEKIKSRWLTALRDGNRKQCFGNMKDGERLCALGVLVDLYREDHKLEWTDVWIMPMGKILRWAQNNSPDTVRVMVDGSPVGIVRLNDMYHYTFLQIADLIEAQL